MYTTSTTTAYLSNAPEVYITNNGNRYKQYNNNIFLPSNSNFEIEVFNPNTHKIGMSIAFANKKISSNLIVILPGQRIFLNRYIDTNNKFVFKTYEIEDTDSTKVIQNVNGKIKIEFFSELYSTPNVMTYFGTRNIDYIPNTTTLYNCTAMGDVGTRSFTDFSYTSGTLSKSKSITTTRSSAAAPKIETGIVDKGDASSQKFNKDNSEYSLSPFYTYEVQLKPESQAAIEYDKIKRYCTNCGTRIRKESWKFCPNCSEPL